MKSIKEIYFYLISYFSMDSFEDLGLNHCLLNMPLTMEYFCWMFLYSEFCLLIIYKGSSFIRLFSFKASLIYLEQPISFHMQK